MKMDKDGGRWREKRGRREGKGEKEKNSLRKAGRERGINVGKKREKCWNVHEKCHLR